MQKTSVASLPVVIASDDTVAISAVSLPLPTSAATSTNQATEITALQAIEANQTNGTQVTTITGTVPLPTNASTLTAQTNVQSAVGTPQTVAITVQGNSSGVAIPVSISGGFPSEQNVNINEYGGTATSLGSNVSASSMPVVIASDQGNVPVSQATASALNATVVQSTASALNATVVQSTASALNATVVQATGTNLHVVTDATSTTIATQATASSLNATVVGAGSAGTPNAGVVTIQGITNGTAVSVSGSSSITGTVIANAPIQNVYSSTNITTSAYVQLVASTTNTINTLHIFDSSGQAMILGIGGSGSEVTTLYVPPGGDTYALHIPSGSRLAYKALTATANSGYLLMSFLE